MRKLQMIDKLLWGVWGIVAILFFEVIVTNNSFEGVMNPWKTYLILLYALVYILSDRQCLERLSRVTNLTIILIYVLNVVTFVIEMIIFERNCVADFGLAPLIRESVIFVFWMLSIILTVISSRLYWIVSAIAIYVNSYLYFCLLNNAFELVKEDSFVFKGLIIGGVFVSIIVSYFIFRKLFHLEYVQKVRHRN